MNKRFRKSKDVAPRARFFVRGLFMIWFLLRADGLLARDFIGGIDDGTSVLQMEQDQSESSGIVVAGGTEDGSIVLQIAQDQDESSEVVVTGGSGEGADMVQILTVSDPDTADEVDVISFGTNV
jgi:hypothetical protein